MSARVNIYSAASLEVLEGLHLDLRLVVEGVLPFRDHTLLRGLRTLEEQIEFKRLGWSKTLLSRHLPGGECRALYGQEPTFPDLSYAVDMAPYFPGGISYNADDLKLFAGVVLGFAFANGIELRWGGDWDRDGDQTDQTFFDRVHFELTRKS